MHIFDFNFHQSRIFLPAQRATLLHPAFLSPIHSLIYPHIITHILFYPVVSCPNPFPLLPNYNRLPSDTTEVLLFYG